MLIAAGTVLTTEQADKAMASGAKFIVSPSLNPTVVKYCIDKGYPIIPGTSNPSDVELALSFGLDVVKFFPAEAAGGIKMIKSMAAQAARQATRATYKAAIAGIKAHVAAIAAGGWIAVVIIIVICLIALIVGSCFGIFFSDEDTGSGITIQTVISDINTEYEAKINETKGTVAYDVLEMSGSRAVWPEVLSVYAVKTAGDPNNPQEVASIDEGKRQILAETAAI